MVRGAFLACRLRVHTPFFLCLLLFVFAAFGPVEAGEQVYVIEIEGEINSGLAQAVEQGIDRAVQGGSGAVLFSINTLGGLVEPALRIRSTILRCPLPTIAFVNDRAWSAGALIALSAETIVMTTASSIGAAETIPRDEKHISAMRGEFRSTAEMRDRDPDLAEAMVDSEKAIEGVTSRGSLLTLTARHAVEHGMADHLADTLDEAVVAAGYSPEAVVFDERPLSELFAILFTQAAVSILLITGGLLGLYVELTTPGWAIPGTLGVILLALFFSAQMSAGAAGPGLLVLFAAGLVLLALELFVIPGFGVTGAGGVLAILASLYLSFESGAQALRITTISLALSIAGAVLLFRYIGRSGTWKRVVLSTSEKKEMGYVAPRDYSSLVGVEGVALSDLRPAGMARIEGERRDVVTEGDFIQQGERIEVIHVEGRRIIVRRIEKDNREAKEE